MLDEKVRQLKSSEILAVVVSFNGAGKTALTVNALVGKVGHVHIVDNGSDAESLDIVVSLATDARVSLTNLSENRGVGYALNVGVNVAKERGYSWLLTMDQDSIIDTFMIDAYCRAIREFPSLVCLAPNLEFGLIRGHDGSSAVKYAITSGNLVSIKLFDEIGFYSEEFFIDGIDIDFSLRVRGAGHVIYKVHDALMEHQLGDCRNSDRFVNRVYTSHPPLRRYYMFRNHMYIIERFIRIFPMLILKSSLSNLILLLLIPFFDKEPFLSLCFAFRGIRDYFKRITGSYKEC